MIKRILSLLMVMGVIMAMSIVAGCESSSADTGTMTLKITDAAIDSEEITGVYIAINEIQVNKSTGDEDANWETVRDYIEENGEPLVFNLSDLTGGEFALLGEFDLEAGQYNQIRFILDIQNQDEEPPSNPGCYVEFNDDPEDAAALFVPSGGQTGYKAVGTFEVPVNGDVVVTVDFDLRKAVHVTGEGNNQRYILKPTLRLSVDSEAGNISGKITLDNEYTDIIVFAYGDGVWDISEADEPAAGDPRFPNAVTSYKMDSDDSYYILAYLAYEEYDLVVAGYEGETFGEVLGIVSDVVLDSNHTNMDIDANNLETAQ